jgi:hypothetical protein
LQYNYEDHIKKYIQPSVLKGIDGGKRWQAELRKVSVMFVMLEYTFKEEQLAELQNFIATMQRIVYKFEGIVRQFLIE